MVEIIHINNDIPKLEKSVACIGYFDGMHKVHQKLINKCVNLSVNKNVLPSLICFSPDPDEIINHKREKHLFCEQERYTKAASFGIQKIYVISFSEELMNLEANVFIHDYLNQMNLEGLVCGFDFSFGRKGLGNPVLLKEVSHFPVTVIDEEKYYGKKISSTRIKENLKSGHFKLADKLLGFSYYFILEVLDCVKTDEKWLLECVNKDERGIIPKQGVYENLFEIRNDHFYLYSDSYKDKGMRIKIEV